MDLDLVLWWFGILLGNVFSFPIVFPPVGASCCLCKMGKHGLYLHSVHVVLKPGRRNSLHTLMPKPTKQEEAAGRPWAPASSDARLEIAMGTYVTIEMFISYFVLIASLFLQAAVAVW